MAETLRTTERAARVRRMMSTERFRWWLAFAILTMFAASRAATVTERDPYWSARAGLETLAGTPLARPDAWSWSAEGLWYPNSPAWNVVLGLGWNALGFWGFFWAAFLAMTLLGGVALMVARRTGARALPTLVTLLPLAFASSAALSTRATVVVHVLLFLAALFAWWWGGRAHRVHTAMSVGLVGIAGFLLSFAGNWVHLSFIALAAAVALMWGVAWWTSPGLGTVHRVLLLLTGTGGLLLGCVLSPYGIALTLERSQAVSEICRDLVTEWMSLPTMVMREGGYIWLPITIGVIAVAAVTVVWVSRLLRSGGRYDPRIRLVVPLLVVALPAIGAGVGTLRFLALGTLLLAPAAAGAVTALVDRLRRRQRAGVGIWWSPRLARYTSGSFWTTVLSVVAVVLLAFTVWAVPAGARPPEASVAARLPHGCQLWSDPSVAGPVLLTRPDVHVWIDGRFDFYGRDHILEFLRVRSGEAAIPAEAECVILADESKNADLADGLNGDPQWTQVAASGGFTLWVRAEP